MNYEIWSEGYNDMGNIGSAHKHGEQEADSFDQACVIFFVDDKFFNGKLLTYWGCRLFDNEAEARKSFG